MVKASKIDFTNWYGTIKCEIIFLNCKKRHHKLSGTYSGNNDFEPGAGSC